MERVEIAANNETIVQYQKARCGHGYHVYKEIWELQLAKLLCVSTVEPGDSGDRNAVAVKKDGKLLDICHKKCHS